MRDCKALLFDLDGTLTDPALGITNSVAYALQSFGISVTDRSELYCFIGPPLIESFMKYYRLSEADAVKAVDIYREYFSDMGIFENRVYDGVPKMLERLKASDKKIILATSKPEVFAKRILCHFDLMKYFDFAAGSLLNHTRVSKHEVIEYALERTQISDREHTVMIGDRKHDIIGGKASSLRTIGVLWGYGDRPELTESGADKIAESIDELEAIIMG